MENVAAAAAGPVGGDNANESKIATQLTTSKRLDNI